MSNAVAEFPAARTGLSTSTAFASTPRIDETGRRSARAGELGIFNCNRVHHKCGQHLVRRSVSRTRSTALYSRSTPVNADGYANASQKHSQSGWNINRALLDKRSKKRSHQYSATLSKEARRDHLVTVDYGRAPRCVGLTACDPARRRRNGFNQQTIRPAG